RRGLWSCNAVATRVHVNVLLDAETAQDPLTIGRALPGDGRLQQPRGMEGAQRGPRCAIEPGHRNRLRVVARAVLDAVTLGVNVGDIGPRQPEHRVER